MNYLCIDFGRQHLGLALATTDLAEPLLTIPTAESTPVIAALVHQHAIDQIVVGLPDGDIANHAKAFVDNLKLTISTPIIFHDETLSTHEAKQKLLHAKKSKRQLDHHFAAALILQDYLDFH
jgi:putative transcription antitermination factor YqgF